MAKKKTLKKSKKIQATKPLLVRSAKRSRGSRPKSDCAQRAPNGARCGKEACYIGKLGRCPNGSGPFYFARRFGVCKRLLILLYSLHSWQCSDRTWASRCVEIFNRR